MIDSKLFIPIRELSQAEFIDAWEKEENSRNHGLDVNTRKRIDRHRQAQQLCYFIGVLTRAGLDTLVLPWHEEGYKVRMGGEPLWDVVSKYLSGLLLEQEDACFERLRFIMGQLNEHFQKTSNLLNTDYVLGRIYDDPQLALPGHYNYLVDKKYVGNFHRFLAYGLWAKQVMDYQPVKVYYCGSILD